MQGGVEKGVFGSLRGRKGMIFWVYMDTMIAIPKTEYKHLVAIAKRYDALRRAFTGDFFQEPSTTSRKEVLGGLKKSGKYSDDFLKGIEKGLKESSFFPC